MFKFPLKKYFSWVSYRFSLFDILLIYISISHIFLPAFHRQDFLFFSKWNRMFFAPRKVIHDITWDEGKTFLFRDYLREAQEAGIDMRWLFHVVDFLHREDNKRHFYSKLIYFCECQKLEIFTLQGSLSDHIIYKKQLKIQGRQIL